MPALRLILIALLNYVLSVCQLASRLRGPIICPDTLCYLLFTAPRPRRAEGTIADLARRLADCEIWKPSSGGAGVPPFGCSSVPRAAPLHLVVAQCWCSDPLSFQASYTFGYVCECPRYLIKLMVAP